MPATAFPASLPPSSLYACVPNRQPIACRRSLNIHPSVPNVHCATPDILNNSEDDLMNFNKDPGECGQRQNSTVGDDEEHHDVIDFDEAVGIFDKGTKQAAEENLGASKRRRNK
ncbi:hypothetical protein DFH08DRAFT_826577 [Mycena albidolilacea]|uniref:Uncharacterized protein n=1 Tax=Mycena albidolilacea TaxID=1033008 RepID=A0AAD6Z008_9AGAR|nr:hypothetical protein DFH08DRAFT_826577 [Mycena albidolilacea]